MKIAILGWGSLIWDPQNLEINKEKGQNGWFPDGPLLPIEFCRISQDGRLTLVIDSNGVEVQTLYAISKFTELDQAILDLAARESCGKPKIGLFVKSNGYFRSKSKNIRNTIESWTNLKEEIDAVIWTDLSMNFKDKMGVDINEENAVNYLKHLPLETKVKAEQYIRQAPNAVITPIRTAIEEKLGWKRIHLTTNEKLKIIKRNEKFGLSDQSGNIILECNYDWIEDFDEKYSRIVFNGKYGLIDENGKTKIPVIYDLLNSFSDGIAKVKSSGKYGFIKNTSEIVIPIIYDEIHQFINGVAIVKFDEKYGLIDKSGSLIVDTMYSKMMHFDDYIIVNFNSKWGIINLSCEEIVPLIYSGMIYCTKEFINVKMNDRWGCIDSKGNCIVPCIYDNIEPFSEGFAAVRNNSYDRKWSFINQHGRELTPFIYIEALPFSNGLAAVLVYKKEHNEFKWGYINCAGELVIDTIYDGVKSFTNKGWTFVRQKHKWGIINRKGEVIFPITFDYPIYTDDYESQFILKNSLRISISKSDLVVQEDRYKSIRKSKYTPKGKPAKLIIDDLEPLGSSNIELSKETISSFPMEPNLLQENKIINSIFGFSEGLFLIKQDDKFGFIDEAGEIVIPFVYDEARTFAEGKAGVKYSNKWGFIDKQGNMPIKAQFDGIDQFSEGIAGVQLENKWLFINHLGNFISPDKYDEIYRFSDGVACVKISDKWGYVDVNGSQVVCPKYDSVESFSDGLAKVSQNYLWGYIDKNGKEIIPLLYDELSEFRSGLARFKRNNSIGKIDKMNDEYWIEEISRELESDGSILYGNIPFEQDFSRDEYTDWSNYNDDLDMDQQSEDFWNQF